MAVGGMDAPARRSGGSALLHTIFGSLRSRSIVYCQVRSALPDFWPTPFSAHGVTVRSHADLNKYYIDPSLVSSVLDYVNKYGVVQ